MKKYEKKHIGERWKTTGGYIAEIVDGGSKRHYCTIQIGNWIKEVAYSSVKKGKVKNPYRPSIFGVGFIGEGNYKITKKGSLTKVYETWASMLRRCYSKLYQNRYPTYKNCTVCEKWHNLQVFGVWFDENYVDGWHLDKDLLTENNKTYSTETCIFLPPKLNTFLTNIQSSNTSGYTGVCWSKNSNKWQASIKSKGKQKYLGYYNDIAEAAEAYKRARKIEAEKLKEEYKDVLPQYILEKIK